MEYGKFRVIKLFCLEVMMFISDLSVLIQVVCEPARLSVYIEKVFVYIKVVACKKKKKKGSRTEIVIKLVSLTAIFTLN